MLKWLYYQQNKIVCKFFKLKKGVFKPLFLLSSAQSLPYTIQFVEHYKYDLLLCYRLIHQTGLLCALSLCAAQSWGHAKIDLITVANGDQITGL